MSETGAVDAYTRILEGVADRADQIGPRVLASHWPFRGSDYRRLLIVGQALAGWDDKKSPALWTAAQVMTEQGRAAVLEGTQAWAKARPEPMDEPLRTRSGSSFWDLSKYVVPALEPEGRKDWHSRHAWWNLFPIGWGETNKSPWIGDGLWEAQLADMPELFWEVVDFLDPTRIVILAGKEFWPHMAGRLGLHDLPRLEWPLIAGDVRDERAIVWTYHPGAHLLGVNRRGFAQAIAAAVRDMEAAASSKGGPYSAPRRTRDLR